MFSFVKDCHDHIAYLAYWLANTSELLFVIEHDRDIVHISRDIQHRLLTRLQCLYERFNVRLKAELDNYYIALINSDNRSENDSLRK
jgi:hypothetical protein